MLRIGRSESMSPTLNQRALQQLATDAVTGARAHRIRFLSIKGHEVTELLPSVDWDRLPTMDVAGTFISQHANPVDAMLIELSSRHSKRA